MVHFYTQGNLMPYPKREVIDGNLPCSKCKQVKPVSEFVKNRRTFSGYASACQSCNYTPVSEADNKRNRKLVDGTQRCTVCKEWKPFEKFEANKKCRNGRGSRCHKCNNKRVHAKYIKSLPAYLRMLATANKSNLKFRIKHRRRKHLWTTTCVTYEYIQQMWDRQQGRCAITGIEMTHARGKGLDLRRNASVDRIDSTKGYEDGNIQLVCNAVNLMKHTMDMDQLDFWCRAILSRK